MSYGNTVTLVGNVTREPELLYSATNIAYCKFGLAWNMKNRDGKETTGFYDVTVWREQAENVASSINKGMRVVINGRLDHQTWEDKTTGANRSKVEIMADEVAPSLRFATANVQKTAPSESSNNAPTRQLPPEEPF